MLPDTTGYNTDKLGVTFTKNRHELYLFEPGTFREAVNWLATVLRREGYDIASAVFDPPREAWHFYDSAGEHVYTCPHDTVDHVWDLQTGNYDAA